MSLLKREIEMTDFMERARACFEAGGECKTSDGCLAKILAIHDDYVFVEVSREGDWLLYKVFAGGWELSEPFRLLLPKQVLTERWEYIFKGGYANTYGSSSESSMHSCIYAYKHTYYDDGTCETERLK